MKFCKLHCVFALVLFVVLTNTSTSYALDESSNRNDTLQTWIKMDKKLKETVQSLIKQVMPMVLESSNRVNFTSKCSKDLFQLLSGLRNLKKWAFSFVDSSAKSVDGSLSSSITNFGVYDQCLDIAVPNSRKKDEFLFRGQYCRVDMYPPLPPKAKRYKLFDRLEDLRNFSGTEVVKFLTTKAHMFYYLPLTLGVCIPSTCTENDLSQMLNVAIEDYYLKANVLYCEVKKEKTEFLNIQIFSIFCCSALAFLVLIGTILEMNSSDDETGSKIYRFLRCFSVISNFKKLSSTKTASEQFRCLHGIRFLSITWVIFGHAYFYPAWFLTFYRTLSRVQETATEPFAQTIINSSMVVDTFFFMSGLLVCYLTIKHVKLNKKKFSIIQFVIHRLWRIVPVYYFVILFIFLVPLMGSGPIFKQTMDDSITPCFTYWWRNLLFINNYSDMKDLCMMHNWYIACDVQLYLASLLVLLPLFKSEKIGLTINILIILFSIVYTGFMTYSMSPVFTILMIFRDPEDLYLGFKYIYANAITRAGPYFIGILVGYILVTRPNIKVPKVIQVIGWCLATLSTSMVVYASAIWFNVHLPSGVEVLIYASLFNVAFTAGVAWMTFCCISGRGGFINRILSWKMWVPLGKLTFSMYLIEPIFQTAYVSVFRSPQDYSHMHFIVQAFGFICISALLALILNLLVESPFLALEKLLLHKETKTVEDSNEKDIRLSNGDVMVFRDPTYESYHTSSMDNHAFNNKE